MTLLVAVDVGTLSARAGVFDAHGVLSSTAAEPFTLRRDGALQATYRMGEVWDAACRAVAGAVSRLRPDAGPIAAIAFDATSSLYLEGRDGPPLENGDDVLCWMDHRGEEEALAVDATGHPFLRHVGGTLSPETNLPKLMWLKRHAPERWAGLVAARDLCDEFARRATGIDRHGVCGLACKWPYLPGTAEPWQHDLLARLGMEDLPRLGALSQPPAPVGAVHGPLSEAAAARLRLPAGIPVSVGLIDAEAGALGVLGRGFRARMNRLLPMIGGTSTSFMTFCEEERFIPGIWGPFRDAVFPGIFMHEAGQSLSGAALDAVLCLHPAGPGRADAQEHARVAARVLAILDAEGPAFAARRHIVPDWLGNRSPLNDARVRALATGLGEETNERAFLEAYYATARALALQTRHIREHLDAHGYSIDTVALSGGHVRNPLLVRLYRDALGADLVLSAAPEPVLLGTAMVASVAAGLSRDLFAALETMSPEQTPVAADPRWRAAHDKAYAVYRRLFETRNALEAEAAALEALAR